MSHVFVNKEPGTRHGRKKKNMENAAKTKSCIGRHSLTWCRGAPSSIDVQSKLHHKLARSTPTQLAPQTEFHPWPGPGTKWMGTLEVVSLHTTSSFMLCLSYDFRCLGSVQPKKLGSKIRFAKPWSLHKGLPHQQSPSQGIANRNGQRPLRAMAGVSSSRFFQSKTTSTNQPTNQPTRTNPHLYSPTTGSSTTPPTPKPTPKPAVVTTASRKRTTLGCCTRRKATASRTAVSRALGVQPNRPTTRGGKRAWN